MRALLSVSDKTGLVDLARGLAALTVELVSTGGTARLLREAGLAVVPIADVTRVPEMLDGRVKTLHPAVHGAILARRHRPDDMQTIAAHGITPIDLVVVNLYPFAAAAARADVDVPALIEEIDIGGPSMLRSAAKNFQDVLVVVDPADYRRVLQELAREGGATQEFRLELARKAFAHTAAYDDTIAATMAAIDVREGRFTRSVAIEKGTLPAAMRVGLARVRPLRYGENPHQPAAWYRQDLKAGFATASVLQGKELSYTNLLDLDAAARIALEFGEPAACVIKHTNPCGVATGATIAEAYVRAREADPLSAFGGIVGLNRPLDGETAKALTSTFLEAVVAPAVLEDARPVLAKKANLRVLEADFRAFTAHRVRDLRSILGGVLVQERDSVEEARAAWPADGLKVVTKRTPSFVEWEALRFAWRVCAHVKSNAVVFTGRNRTLAIGAGQMSRVDAVKVAVMKAGGALPGSVAASDAFFPFRDGLDAIAEAGATAVVQPGGSVRDPEVIAAADEHDLAMVLTGIRHFRH
ncbi:MAG TPA: bifunctional phosphoribosylaminoimidazolecarboxamide formyltransferase/IMP cyclohydrolase [Vicinamibacterales bacterium]|nr:bifunctional phosphoribosylaminoimidazolecarboxamide formyltransferase/IMP cyclohydrolase [Vicinamibacterales bacterium]